MEIDRYVESWGYGDLFLKTRSSSTVGLYASLAKPKAPEVSSKDFARAVRSPESNAAVTNKKTKKVSERSSLLFFI